MTLARSATLTTRHLKEFGDFDEIRRINFSSDVMARYDISRYARIVKCHTCPAFSYRGMVKAYHRPFSVFSR